MSGSPWTLRVACPSHGSLHVEGLSDDDAADDGYLSSVISDVADQHGCPYRLEVSVREAHVLR